MATNAIFSDNVAISPRNLREQLRSARSIELVDGVDRVLLGLACHHIWSWPINNEDGRVHGGYDAHQNCPKCASQRLFNSTVWKPGPIYRRVSRKIAKIAFEA